MFLKMNELPKNEMYRCEIDRLARRQHSLETPCPFDGLSCCSICEDCGHRFCECGSGADVCMRSQKDSCPVIRETGVCPKGWKKEVV